MLTAEDMQEMAEWQESLSALDAEMATFEDSVVQAEIENSEDCRVCGGSGEVGTGEREWETGAWVTEECRACRGTGERGYE